MRSFLLGITIRGALTIVITEFDGGAEAAFQFSCVQCLFDDKWRLDKVSGEKKNAVIEEL